MKQRFRTLALTLAAVTGLCMAAPTMALASSRGKRNTAIVLGAVGVYGLVKKKPLIAGLGLGGAAYTYTQSRRERDRERRDWRRDRHRRHVHVFRGGRRVCRH